MLQGHFYSGEKLIWIPDHKGISGDEAAAGALANKVCCKLVHIILDEDRTHWELKRMEIFSDVSTCRKWVYFKVGRDS